MGLFENTADTGMKLPAGVVANAPYQGHAPMLPHISVPLTAPLTRPRSLKRADAQAARASETPAPAFLASSSSSFSFSARDQTLAALPAHAASQKRCWTGAYAIRPTPLNAAVLGLSEAQLHQITGSEVHPERQGHSNYWTYEMRRAAQPVLPYLYLGPSNAARDRRFLQGAGITKLMAVRDSRLATARLLAVDDVAREMGIESECVDVAGLGGLLRALPGAVQSINQHMLAAPTDAAGVSMGKVLVFCETGNVRAPPVVAAYLMSLYGLALVDTLRFVSKCRFCISLDEEAKHMLLSFSDLLNARRAVADQASDADADDAMGEVPAVDVVGVVDAAGAAGAAGVAGADADRAVHESVEDVGRADARCGLLAVPPSHAASARGARSRSRPPKRHVEETMDVEDDRIEGVCESAASREPSAEPGHLHLDMARYQDRGQFAPFTDMGAEQRQRPWAG